MSRILIATFAFLAALLSLVASAQEPARLALLIGNQGYAKKVGPLKNPHNDVDLVAASLTKVGFKVTVLKDAGYKAMDTALKRYVTDVRRAGPGALSFFYYSGHGVANPETQVNYLVPIDVADAEDDKLWFESFQQNTIIDLLSTQAQQATHYLVFDACRNELNVGGSNAKALGADKGFVPVNNSAGLLIAYATAPKRTASDAGVGGGPYAKVLAEEIVKPGIEAVSMFRSVQIRVKQSIGQDPWLTFPSLPAVYFAGKATDDAINQSGDAEWAWTLIKDTNSAAALEAFIARYSATSYAQLARARIEELKKQQVAAAKIEAERQVKEAKRPGLVEQAVGLILPRDKSEPTTRPTREQQLSSRPTVPLTSAEEKALKPGNIFMECVECPEMVVVPAGEFVMGSSESEVERLEDEGPQHKVTIRKPFAVGKFEVTFAEWAFCATGGGCAGNLNPEDEGWGRGRRPVINVSWDDTLEYLAWLSKRTGKTYRLLTEAEWEYAARGVTDASAPHPPFSTGATISTAQANYRGIFIYGAGVKGRDWERTVEVGTFAGNPFGLHDMHGNVWEWVQDTFNRSYKGAPSDGSAVTSTIKDVERVVRGGAWHNMPGDIRSAIRIGHEPGHRSNSFGFRVARMLGQ